jgi:hypothetical protein
LDKKILFLQYIEILHVELVNYLLAVPFFMYA